MGLVSVRDSAHLKAVVLALKAAPKEIRGDVRTQTRNVARSQWQRELTRESSMVQQTRLIADTARVTVSDQSIKVVASALKRKRLSGGGTPVQLGKAFEFGDNPGWSKVHGAPSRRRSGYVFYPALATMAPRIMALWIQTATRVVHNALEGKR